MSYLLRLPAPYFFTLATMLVMLKGRTSPVGTSYDGTHCLIERSERDGSITVYHKEERPPRLPHLNICRQDKTVGPVVASRGPGGDMLTGMHVKVAAEIERQVEIGLGGGRVDRVFTFSFRDADGSERRVHVEAGSLGAASRHAMDSNPGIPLVDMLATEPSASFEGEGPVLVAPRLAARRAWDARLAAARDCPHEVYRFSWRDPEDGRLRPAPQPILARDLADAESAFRGMDDIPPGVRVARIDIGSMVNYLKGEGPNAGEPMRSPGLLDAPA